MSNFDVEARTILKVIHGSHAYNLAMPTSDLDVKGVCIEPKSVHFGFLNKFEQLECMASKGGEYDLVIYSLKKFAHLAADCNPNIIEILHVDDNDVLVCDSFGEELRASKDAFLSRKARHTFSGYANSQLKRIKMHRAWLLDPPAAAPVRADFGLTETAKVSNSELGAFDSIMGLDSIEDSEAVVQNKVTAAIVNGQAIELPKNVVTLFTREKSFQAAQAHFAQYQNWLKTRNPARAELEAKHGFDTKHGCHLLRLMRMCKEILATGKVIVKRPDREELLDIRNGRRSYDSVIEEADCLESECASLYETSVLPHSPDRNALDSLVVSMTDRYLTLHG